MLESSLIVLQYTPGLGTQMVQFGRLSRHSRPLNDGSLMEAVADGRVSTAQVPAIVEGP